MNFEEWLSQIIKDKNINISEMSRKTKIPYRSIYASLFDRNRYRELRSSELLKICRYVGVNPLDFQEDEITKS